jgi:general stress protein 26
MTDPKRQLEEVVGHFRNAMVVTRTPDGALRARPMAVAKAEPNGNLWFLTSASSGKVDELRDDDHLAVTMQSSTRFVSLTGRGRIERDPAKRRELWSDLFRAWFPKGPDDPDLAVIELVAEQGEYWDQHGVEGLRYLFEVAKAAARGERAGDGRPERHGKANL